MANADAQTAQHYGIQPHLRRDAIASLTALTDNTGGTASDTLAAITGSYVEATMENSAASLAGKINEVLATQEEILDALREAGIVAV